MITVKNKHKSKWICQWEFWKPINI